MAGAPARPIVTPWSPEAAPGARPPPLPDPGPRPAGVIPAPGGRAGAFGPALRRVWAARGVWLAGLALGVGAAGEWLLFLESLRGLAAAVLVLAMLLGVLAWSGTREAPLLAADPTRAWWRIAWRRELVLRGAGIALAVALIGAAVDSYLAAPEAIFGAQGWFWVASMSILLFSCSEWYPRAPRTPDPGPPWTRAEGALFLGLLALALVTHLAWLDEIPWRFHFDEGFAFTEIMRYYRGPLIPLFTTTWHETSLPSLFFAFEAGLMRFTGIGLAGTRLGVALIGTCLVIPVYGIARLAWGRLAAALAGFAIAVSAAAVHYSRVSILNIITAFWWACCCYFLLRGLRSRRPGDFVWAGLIAGTSMYTYYGTRLLPYLLLAFLGYLLVCHWRAARERLGHFALVAIGFFAGFGPLLGYFLRNPAMWASRGLSVMMVPAVIPSTWAGWVQDWNILAPLAWSNYLGLSAIPGRDTVYYAPLLLAPEALLLTLGAGVLIWRWRQPAAFLLLLCGLGVVLTGGTLLDSTTIPNFAHWTPAFGVFYLALVLPLALGLGALRRLHRALWLVGCALLVVALAGDALANAQSYLIDYPAKVPPDHSLEALQGRFIEQVGPQTQVYIVGPSWQSFNPEVAGMMGPQTPASELYNVDQVLPLTSGSDHDLAFVFFNDQFSSVPLVQAYYPGGQTAEVQTPDGNHVATSYRVSAAQVVRTYGVQVQVATAGVGSQVQAQGVVTAVGRLPAGPAIQYPAQITWSGALFAPASLPIRLVTQGGAPATITVEGRPVSAGVPVPITPGWVRFAVQARLERPIPLQLLLQQGDGSPAAPDRFHLWPFTAPPGAGGPVTIPAPQP